MLKDQMQMMQLVLRMQSTGSIWFDNLKITPASKGNSAENCR